MSGYAKYGKHTTEYDSSIKRMTFMLSHATCVIHAITRMNLKNTDSAKEATKSYTLKDDVYTKCLEQANSQKESRLVAARGWRWE